VSLLARETLPQPHEAIGVVSNDLAQRTLTVKLSDTVNGYTKLLWRQAFQALKASEEGGWANGHPTVWASTPNAYQVAYAQPGNPDWGGQLRFEFPIGAEAYTKLISKPGLTASVWIDRGTNRFINVNLKHAR
jgi:hypothetical protein